MLPQPVDSRWHYREGKDFKKSTYGTYPGFLQTNVSIVPAEYAEDFATFCRNNSAPCPVIFQSAPGQTDAPTLADDSDIRTDISTYQEYEKGVAVPEPVSNLLNHPWDNMVSFHLGCSFSFDSRLVNNGILLKRSEEGTVSMFPTNIPCIPSGPFNCNMVVSMRPIPRNFIEKIVELTVDMDFAHGAPIHIGNPGDIGVSYTRPDPKSDPGSEGEVEVPCFWACGVTGSMAVRSAELSHSFSHFPGSMFVTDILSEDVPNIVKSTTYPRPVLVCTDPLLERYVTVSHDAMTKLAAVEEVITSDPGNRGSKHLVVPGDFAKACLDLSMRAKRVGILVGFPLFDTEPAEENDGIAGAIYLARALQSIGVEVTVLVDATARTLANCLSQCQSKAFTSKHIPVVSIGKSIDGLLDLADSRFTHLIAIERPSPASDGRYYTMRGRDVSDNVGAMAELFRLAHQNPDITTIGIGDGGNELGMGKVKDSVKLNVPNGDTIAADVSADFLISCGVSNWGGLAVAAGLFAVRACPVHDRYKRRGIGLPNSLQQSLDHFLPTSHQDLELHSWLTEMGFRDGCSGVNGLSVDGLQYVDCHAQILRNVRSAVE